MKSSAIACFYLRKRFTFDLIVSIPFHRGPLSFIRYLSLIKVFRLFNVKDIINKFNCTLTLKLFFKIGCIFLVIPTINHILACVWIHSVD